MDTARLYEILKSTTVQLRKGPEVARHRDGHIEVMEIFAMPHTDEVNLNKQNFETVDMHFIAVAVDKRQAELHKDDLIKLLKDYPHPERLAGGPSYIEVGAVLGDQGAAFCLFALGKVLGLWDVITPEKFGMDGEQAAQAAGRGFIMMTGYRSEAKG